MHEYSLEWVVEVGEVRERDGVDGAQVEVLVPVQQLQVRVEVLQVTQYVTDHNVSENTSPITMSIFNDSNVPDNHLCDHPSKNISLRNSDASIHVRFDQLSG